MKYARILLAGAAVPVTALILITVIATGYAFALAFEVRGAPDQVRIAQFAQQIGRASWTALLVLFTMPFALWASRTFGNRAAPYGAAVGLVVAAIQFLLLRDLSVEITIGAALTVGAGWLGGAVAASRVGATRVI
jgi:hypothetical protein